MANDVKQQPTGAPAPAATPPGGPIDRVEAKRLYMQRWRRANRDKVRAQQQRYWERKAAAYNAALEARGQTDGEAEA